MHSFIPWFAMNLFVHCPSKQLLAAFAYRSAVEGKIISDR